MSFWARRGGRKVLRTQKTKPESPVKSQENQEATFVPQRGWVLSGHRAWLGVQSARTLGCYWSTGVPS